MRGWLSLTDEQRRISLEQASVRSGIQTKAIEKDWWVTLCLKALFTTPYAQYCIFKGGTSLSKGWKLIERFSEDADIALAPEAFGMEYLTAPSHSYVKTLKRKGCEFTSTVLKDALQQALIGLGVPAEIVTIEAEAVRPDIPDKDPQTLFIRYKSLFDPDDYLIDEVKMEFGVRSLKDPFSVVSLQSILSEFFPNTAYEETPFDVFAVQPQKTLIEKLFLLHEKFTYRYPQSIQGDRQSRHLYDIVQLAKKDIGKAVLEDTVLYATILEHRRHYVRLGAIDYDTLYSSSINFVPSSELEEFFRDDYAEMQRSMIYGDSPDFDDLLIALKWFNGSLRLAGTGLMLENVIDQFEMEHQEEVRLIEGIPVLRYPVEVKTKVGSVVVCMIEMRRRILMLLARTIYKWEFESLDIIEEKKAEGRIP